MSGKKLINSVEKCVDESLEGVVKLNPSLQLLRGHRVVVRGDISDVIKAGKVTLISGGGSGHEPAHAGFVGYGMLSAAVAGPVFASPPPADILAAIRTVGSTAGTILIVKNYTGDRLNFGLAAERAKGEGFKVAMVIVNEDCALASADKTAGRRGLCGVILIHKIAGALAEEGRPLDEIVSHLNGVIRRMGTIGLGLTPCSVPGSGPSFTLDNDEMELGLGIHGEAGVERLKLRSSKETVKIMVDHMTDASRQTALHLKPGDEIACVVNNLGGTSVLEMNILLNDTCTYLESLGLVVNRLYSGPLLTSLEMAGFSVTILLLDDITTHALDMETSAPGWPKGNLLSETPKRVEQIRIEPPAVHSDQKQSEGFTTVGQDVRARLYKALEGACQSLVNAETELNDLDTQSGDGDCGTTLKRGAQAILEALGSLENPGFPLDNPSELSHSLADCVENSMGGSSGGLYALFLTAVSRELQSGFDVQSFASALTTGITAIQRYGGANAGDRTMLDALIPMSQTLNALQNSSESVAEITHQLAVSAQRGAMSTLEMKAHAGRASYVSPDLVTKADPGAIGVAIWMRGISEATRKF